MLLYRPVGLHELKLIAVSGFREFPPRLSHQPIFYPVLELEYARQIAREWNAPDRDSGFAGFVTRFEIDDDFAAHYPIKTAGAARHRELWVPAEELDELNRHIVGSIEVLESFVGSSFTGRIDPATNLPLDV